MVDLRNGLIFYFFCYLSVVVFFLKLFSREHAACPCAPLSFWLLRPPAHHGLSTCGARAGFSVVLFFLLLFSFRVYRLAQLPKQPPFGRSSPAFAVSLSSGRMNRTTERERSSPARPLSEKKKNKRESDALYRHKNNKTKKKENKKHGT